MTVQAMATPIIQWLDESRSWVSISPCVLNGEVSMPLFLWRSGSDGILESGVVRIVYIRVKAPGCERWKSVRQQRPSAHIRTVWTARSGDIARADIPRRWASPEDIAFGWRVHLCFKPHRVNLDTIEGAEAEPGTWHRATYQGQSWKHPEDHPVLLLGDLSGTRARRRHGRSAGEHAG